MASSQNTNHIKCAKCQKPADFACNSCEEKFCSKCQKQHTKSKSTRNHKVSPLSDALERDECSLHPSNTYDMCCKDCELPVCVTCVTENHVGHVFVAKDVMFKQKRKAVVSSISALKNTLLPKYRELHNEVLANITKCKQVMANMRISIEEKAQEIKALVDAELEKNMKLLENMEISLLQKLLLEESSICGQLTSLTEKLDELEYKLETYTPVQLMMTNSKLTVKEGDIPCLNRLIVPEYHSKSTTEVKISRLIGEIIVPADATEVPVSPMTKLENLYNNMTCSVKKVIGIAPSEIQYGRHISCMRDGRAWVSDRLCNMILLDIHGNTLHKLTLRSKGDGYHCATINNDLLYIDKTMKRVSRFLLQEQRVESLFSTPKTWAAISIHSSWINEEILIGMHTKQDAKIVRFSTTGNELEEIHKSSTNGENLYCYPHYITEGPSGDICTSDFEKFSVIVVNRRGQHKFTYKGTQKSQFFPHGICTDRVGNILICDNQCKYRIHMLDPDGVFLRFLLSKEDGIMEPLGLCLDDRNYLWIGQRGKESVSVFKYDHQEKENVYM